MIPAALPPSTSGWSPHVHRHTLRVPGISGSGCCPTGTSLFGAHWVEGAIVVAMCRSFELRKRLRGLQFMLRMVDAVGDRVGEQEFREIEEQHTVKQGVKKFGKSKDLRIGLLMLLATINKVGSAPTEAKEGEETSWVWMMLCTLSCIGALSLIKWTRGYVSEFLEGTKAFIREITKAMVWVKGIDLSVKVKRVDQETQVSVPNARLERELEETANELFLRDLCVEELEQELKMMKEKLNDFLLERDIAEKYSMKLKRRFHNLSMTPSGRVLHFSSECPHFAVARAVRICCACLNEGGVSEDDGAD
eukprot:g26336.t1